MAHEKRNLSRETLRDLLKENEDLVRGMLQMLLQKALEAEMEERLGAARYSARCAVTGSVARRGGDVRRASGMERCIPVPQTPPP